MSDKIEYPDWIYPGATVIVENFVIRGHSYEQNVVERLTATQVILTNGERYLLKRLAQIGNNRKHLRNPSDPHVMRWMSEQNRDRAAWALEASLSDARRGRIGWETVRAKALHLLALLPDEQPGDEKPQK